MADDSKSEEQDLDEICGVKKPLKDARIKLKDSVVIKYDKEHYKKLRPLLNDYDRAWMGRDVIVYSSEEPLNEDDLGDNFGYDNLSYDSVGQF